MSLSVTLFYPEDPDEEIYYANITHNLVKMAHEAGLYETIWRPDELNLASAWQLIEPLQQGLIRLQAHPDYYRQFDAPNGWGTYDTLVPWVIKYLAACIENPGALIRVSR